ncbi:MAG: hypothetical protein GOU97_03545 [Nanoarchaeota archaeon]|nr:hypothetical protein [Nanoarchaeota archaeon]
MINKGEFLRVFEIAIKRYPDRLNENAADYIRTKGNALIDLFIDLENRSLFITSKDELKEIEKEIENVFINFESIKKLHISLTNVILNRKKEEGEKPKTEIEFRDDKGNKLVISTVQYVTILGIFYSSLCEIIYHLLKKILNLASFRESNNEPMGLGA